MKDYATLLLAVATMAASLSLPAQAETFGPGTHVVNGLIVTVPAGASVTIEAPTSVVTIGGGPVTPGPIVPNPNPSSLQGKAKAAADLISDPETAYLLSVGYKTVSSQIDAGKYATMQAVLDDQKQVNRTLWARSADPGKWAAWEANVSDELDRQQTAGDIVGVAGMSRAWKEIATGLELSEGVTASARAIDLEKVIALVLAVLTKDQVKIIAAILALFGGK